MRKNKVVKKFNKTMLVISAMVAMMLLLAGCGKSTDAFTDAGVDNVAADEDVTIKADDVNAESGAITIVYTNDIHSYIDNVKKDEDGSIVADGLRFSKIAAMVKDMKADGGNVLLVDAGDEIQGDIYGAMDEGETIINIMKATGYDLATPGNHDFDYGVMQFLKLAENAGFPYVTCNFHSVKSKEIIFADSYMFDIGGKKVAFVGVTTPATITSSTPVYFQDEKGEFIYTIDGLGDKNNLYTSVQNAVDKVKEEADYVICIGHLGVGMDAVKNGWDSKSVIANVSGINAFIDGHSHTTMDGEIVKDKQGNDVVLTQTGCYLTSVGVMTIAEDGTISTSLVNDYDKEDEQVALIENEWIGQVGEKMNEKIGVLENKLCTNNPDNKNERLIRSRELNLGDLTADSVYWFFNERLGLDCDIAIVNGGGVRNEIEKGDISYFSVKQVQPFGNMICLISATGQQIVDALEMGVTEIGNWNDEWNMPAENGGFLHVAGLTYTVDGTIPSGVQTDANEMFTGVDGEYRVRDVKVYNKAKGIYEDIDLDKEYQLGGINYLLRNGGNGLSMFDGDELTVDYVGMDYVIMSEYIKSFALSDDGNMPLVNTANSPLSAYKGYLLDYDNPYGAGRISIILE